MDTHRCVWSVRGSLIVRFTFELFLDFLVHSKPFSLMIFELFMISDFFIIFRSESQVWVILSDSYNIKWGASSQWSFGPNSAWGSIETTIIGNTHLTLLVGNESLRLQVNLDLNLNKNDFQTNCSALLDCQSRSIEYQYPKIRIVLQVHFQNTFDNTSRMMEN